MKKKKVVYDYEEHCFRVVKYGAPKEEWPILVTTLELAEMDSETYKSIMSLIYLYL